MLMTMEVDLAKFQPSAEPGPEPRAEPASALQGRGAASVGCSISVPLWRGLKLRHQWAEVRLGVQDPSPGPVASSHLATACSVPAPSPEAPGTRLTRRSVGL